MTALPQSLLPFTGCLSVLEMILLLEITSTGWIGSDHHGTQIMNPTDFSSRATMSLTFLGFKWNVLITIDRTAWVLMHLLSWCIQNKVQVLVLECFHFGRHSSFPPLHFRRKYCTFIFTPLFVKYFLVILVNFLYLKNVNFSGNSLCFCSTTQCILDLI